jgi:protein TonB
MPPPPAPRREARPDRPPQPDLATPPPRAQPGPVIAPAAGATPAPGLTDLAAAPLLTGAPRFRRPPTPPDYPARAREHGEEGVATLRLLVDAEGTTRDIRLYRSAGNRLLDEAALAAARRWEVAPAVIAGRPTAGWVEIPVRFRLEAQR